MNKVQILFLKAVTILIGIAAAAVLIRFPQTEGRAANLDLLSIYLDPVIVYMYVASITFFIALYQAFKLLGFIERDEAFSLNSVKALRTIKYCAIAGVCFIVVGEVWILIANMAQGGKDDPAGAVAMGVFMTFASVVVASMADIFEKIVKKQLKQNTP